MPFSPAFDKASLHAAYASGFTPAQMINEVFSRLETIDDPGIFITLADKQALLAEAQALGSFDPVGKPLWGLPFAVKDNRRRMAAGILCWRLLNKVPCTNSDFRPLTLNL